MGVARRHRTRPGDHLRPAVRGHGGAGLSAAEGRARRKHDGRRDRPSRREPHSKEIQLMFSRPARRPADPLDSRRPGRPRRRTALLAVGALTAGLLLIAPQPASAANLVKNPGFETAGTDDMPYCWEKSGWGDNDFTFSTVADAHSGTKAMKVELTRRVEGDRKALITESADLRAGRQRRQAVRPRALVQVDDPGHLAHPLPARHDGRLAVLDRPQDPADQRRLDRRRRSVRPRSRRAPTASPGASPSTARAPRPPTTTRWTRSPTRSRRPRVHRHGRGVRQRQVGRAAHAEPGPLHALRRPQQRQGAADRGLRQQRGACSTRARSPARSTTR